MQPDLAFALLILLILVSFTAVYVLQNNNVHAKIIYVIEVIKVYLVPSLFCYLTVCKWF